MTNMEIKIEKVQFDGGEIPEVRLAQVCAELDRQGVNFDASETKDAYVIRLTGGF